MMKSLILAVALAAAVSAEVCGKVDNVAFTNPPYLSKYDWAFNTKDLLSVAVRVPKMDTRLQNFKIRMGSCLLDGVTIASANPSLLSCEEWIVSGVKSWSDLTGSCGSATLTSQNSRYQTYTGKLAIIFDEKLPTDLVPGIPTYRNVSHDLLYRIEFDRIVDARHQDTIWSKPVMAKAITEVRMKVTNIDTQSGKLHGRITYAIGDKFEIEFVQPLSYQSSNVAVTSFTPAAPGAMYNVNGHNFVDVEFDFVPVSCSLNSLWLTAQIRAKCAAAYTGANCPITVETQADVTDAVATFKFDVTPVCAMAADVVEASAELYAYKTDLDYSDAGKTQAYFLNKVVWLQGHITSDKVTVVATELVHAEVSDVTGANPSALIGASPLVLFDNTPVAPADLAFGWSDDKGASLRDGISPRFHFTSDDGFFQAPSESFSTIVISATFRVTYRGNGAKRADATQTGTIKASFDSQFLRSNAAASASCSVAPWF